eukprot:CAMPEP_0174721146 /NCGR_PEP_ID=MMETSP1094-20130205/35425_1 /TAXON_ID=156173 /ORGANISM="Chrysochromulina brevifilum, Strain UTEX LB 985" /LENGTH=34 /DNA_ID= /DNA_START= /DNA_END= /DNA_ORIENTATION=
MAEVGTDEPEQDADASTMRRDANMPDEGRRDRDG